MRPNKDDGPLLVPAPKRPVNPGENTEDDKAISGNFPGNVLGDGVQPAQDWLRSTEGSNDGPEENWAVASMLY